MIQLNFHHSHLRRLIVQFVFHFINYAVCYLCKYIKNYAIFVKIQAIFDRSHDRHLHRPARFLSQIGRCPIGAGHDERVGSGGADEARAATYKQRKGANPNGFAPFLAVRTRLELATSGVTGRHSNQTELPHHCAFVVRMRMQR